MKDQSIRIDEKQTANDVNILLAEFNIANLPSGNYNITIEVKNKDNKIVAVQILVFQRKNKQASFSYDDLKSIDVSSTFVGRYKSIDTLYEYIRSLRPISGSSEVQYSENQLKGKNLQLMQQFFYNFWKLRDALQPEVAWEDYHADVLKVNKEYKANSLKGYDTDRGRVYLQYGPPNIMGKYYNEENSFPFEIWQYYTLTDKSKEFSSAPSRQSDRKFVFFNPDLISNTYKLLHSNALGEINNPAWELSIFKQDFQTIPGGNLDTQTIPPEYGAKLDDLWNNPR